MTSSTLTTSAVEQQYRRWIRRWYPRDWRAVNEDALVGALLDAAEAAGISRMHIRDRLDLARSGTALTLRARPGASIRSTASSVMLGLGLAYTIAYAIGVPRTRPTMEPSGHYQPWLPLAIWTAATVLVVLRRPTSARIPLLIAAVLFPAVLAAGTLGLVRWFNGPITIQQPGFDDVIQAIVGSPSVLTLVFLTTAALVTLTGTPKRLPALVALTAGLPAFLIATSSHIDSDEAFWRPWNQPFASGGIGIQLGITLITGTITAAVLFALGKRHPATVALTCLIPFIADAATAIAITSPGSP